MKAIARIPRTRQVGVTLVELMVAMAIGLVLTAGIGQIYLGTRNVYRINENAARLQENGRFAIDELNRDIRMAGFAGCSSNTSINNLAKSADGNFTEAIMAYDVVPASPSIGISSTDVYGNTDVIRIQRAVSAGAKLDGNLNPNNAQIQITNNKTGFVAGDIVVVSDCVKTDVFEATNVSSSSGKVTIAHASNANVANKLSKIYQDKTDILRLSHNLYYVGSGTDPNCPKKNLCRKRLTGNSLGPAEILADNVEDMQIKVGEDMNTDADSVPNRADRYIDPGTAGIVWKNIVSTRVELLISSKDDNVATVSQTPVFNGSALTGITDKKLRRVFASTVTLRNRAP